MKKWIILLLLLLVLVGCSREHILTRLNEWIPAWGEAEIVPDTPSEPQQPLPPDTSETPDTPSQPQDSQEVSEPDVPPSDPKAETIEALLATMTREEKVGQLIFARCPASGQREAIEQYHLGGYLLFGRDFCDTDGAWLTREQFTESIAAYQTASRIPLLIGSDEEGGSVTRASRNPNLFTSLFRSPQKLLQRGGMDAITTDAFEKSVSLLELGINVNFAPVADVSTDPTDFIYDRTLGQGAVATAEYVRSVVAEMQNAGIGMVLKHFPGYGSNVDTHTGIAVDERPYESFAASDFLPFIAGIEAGADSVLVSHNIVTAMDADLPASLSPEVHRILREELSFEGVILTDDLAMDAVKAYAEDSSAAVLAILAGNDMIVTTSFAEDIAAILDAVADGTIAMEQIDSAVRRVLAWKYDLGLLQGD